MRIEDATNLYVGSSQASSAYIGSSQIWPTYVPAQHQVSLTIEDFAINNDITTSGYVPNGTYEVSSSPNINVNINGMSNVAIVTGDAYQYNPIIMRINTHQQSSLRMKFSSNDYLSQITFNIPCPINQSSPVLYTGGPIAVDSGSIVYNTADVWNTTVVWTGHAQSLTFDFTSSSQMEFNSLEIITTY